MGKTVDKIDDTFHDAFADMIKQGTKGRLGVVRRFAGYNIQNRRRRRNHKMTLKPAGVERRRLVLRRWRDCRAGRRWPAAVS